MNHSFTNTFGLDYARIIWIPKKIDIVEQDNEKTANFFHDLEEGLPFSYFIWGHIVEIVTVRPKVPEAPSIVKK